ncbi:Structural maintenance of chromosomes protein 1A [Penicillium digitatum]|nr:Structural maintenance of chromosomes protein 1A [Penicillium digitatum]
MDEDILEPDLPPTPTQLGLEKAPDRPRGMLSSSPSRRQEKRAKRRIANSLHESPLKAVNFQSSPLEDSEMAANLGGVSAAVREKRNSREKSAADLRQLRIEVEELETWAKKIESNPDLEGDIRGLDKFLSLLTSEEANLASLPVPRTAPQSISSLLATLLPFSANTPRLKRELPSLPTNPFALQEASQSLPYLTAFAPLSLKTRTTRSSRGEELSETHTLTFSPPPPFPASLYNVTVVYETNPETQSLTSVSVSTGSDSKKRKAPEALRRWIDTRLENPLLKLDAATLCWGINRYWESAITRARLWAHIDHKYGPRASQGRKDAALQSKNGVITLSELRRLVPHFDRSAMVIKPKSSNSSPRVLLSNALVLDEWTGEPQLRPEISVSIHGVDKKIDQEAKKLFHALLREDGVFVARGVEGSIHVDAVIRATEGALGALFGGL